MFRYKNLLLTFLAMLILFASFSTSFAHTKKLKAVAIAKNDHVYYWWKGKDEDGKTEFTVNSATTNFSKVYFPPKPFHKLPNPLLHDKTFLAAAIAGSDDHAYYWWKGKNAKGKMEFIVTSGTSQDPTKYRLPQPFGKLGGKKLIAAAIAGNDRVYYWWKDKAGNITNSVGTSEKPTEYIIPRNVKITSLTTDAYKLIDASIAKSNDRVYYFWKKVENGEIVVSSGTSTEPFKYKTFYSANQP